MALPQDVVQVTLPQAAGVTQLDGLPIEIISNHHIDAGLAVDAQALNATVAEQLSPFGFAMRMQFADAQRGQIATSDLQHPLHLRLDYSQIPLPYGGSVADRLVIIHLSGCSEATGELLCTTQQRLAGENDRANQKLTVDLTRAYEPPFADDPAHIWPESPRETKNEEGDDLNKLFLPTIKNGGGSIDDVYILAASATSGQGDYTATPIALVSDYQVGLFTGAAQTSQSIPVPPAAAGPAPAINLVYNSGAVDGMNHSRNSQPGWVGIGWTLESGYITRHMRACGVVGRYFLHEFCINGDDYSITLNGATSRLVKESGQKYRLRNDPHWLVEKFSNGVGDNPDAHKEYWIVTTPDGTKYRFGGEIDPETGADQNSVWYGTVYDYDTAMCGSHPYDMCDKAWRWNLDRVEDPNGNLTTYNYATEINYYGARGYYATTSSTFRRDYVRAGYLTRIEYGRRVGDSSTQPTRVEFVTEERCEGTCSWPSNYPDTPGDLVCTATQRYCYHNSQSFWSRKQLDYVEPQTYNQTTSSWEAVARYDLDYSFPTAPTDPQGDGSERKLFLTDVAQKLADGTSPLPGVSYAETMLPNRRNYSYAGVSPMYMPRIEKITTQLGGEVEFTYGQSHPCPELGQTIRPPYDCFVGWDAFTGGGGWVWWQKWKVMEMEVSDTFSGNDVQTLTYDYSTPTWHYWEDIGCVACGNHLWNDFRGHAIVTVTDDSGAKTEHRFYRGMDDDRLNVNGGTYNANITLSDSSTRTDSNWLAGLVAETRRLDANGTALTRTVNWYDATSTAGSGIYGARFVAPSKVEQTLYGATNKTTRTEYEYDAYGNLTREILHGDISTTADDRNLERGYIYNVADYIVNTPWWEKLWSGLTSGGGGGGPVTTCNTYASTDVPKSISSSGTPTIYSYLSVASGAEITDVNVLNLKGTHTWINDLDFTLKSPAGTPVQIMKQSCGSQNNFDINFDDEAASGTLPCPPIGGGTYKPSYALSAFDGQDGTGSWELRVKDNYTNDGGSLNSWGLHICTVENVPPSAVGTEKAFTLYAYDGGVIGDAPTKGNLTRVRSYSQVSPSTVYADTTSVYDVNGRPTSVTDANNHTTGTSYHSFYGYPASVTNALGHVTTSVVDPDWGVVTKVTDANNHVTELDYDGYGRLKKVWLPTEPTSGPASMEYVYDVAARPARVQSKVLFDAGTSHYLESWAFVDGFGRDLQSQRTSTTSGKMVLTSVHHNDLGQVDLSSAPYEVTGTAGSGYMQPTWSSLKNYSRATYDELGNPTINETMSLGSALWSTSASYDGWTVTATDANGHETDRTSNAFGQLVEVVEHNDEGSGEVTYTTAYEYDTSGNLTKVTDHDSNITTMSYDLLGRKVGMTDPDMGTWTYQYDPVGNLKAQQDGRGLWIHLSYDDLNRLIAKRKDSISGALISEYFYDAAGYKGLLDKSKAYSGAGTTEVRVVTYDARNRPTRQEWVIPGAGGGTFRMDYAYSAGGQRTSLTYPGGNAAQQGEVVTYGYDTLGQLNNVAGSGVQYLSSATYNAQGQMTQMVNDTGSNGVTRESVYDPNTLRLTTMKAGMSSPFENLQKLSYVYDSVGNITSLTDMVNGSQVQSFGYDWLDRLTSASTNAVGTGQYSDTYTYNAIGNITNNDGNAYAYSSSQPHAVTSAFGNSYGYDANGNQTSRMIGGAVYTFTFDYENRITKVKQGTTVVGSFVYDANGSRVIGTVSGVTTVYVAGVYEYQGGATTKYYEGNAMRRTSYASGNGVFYLLRDHLGSSSVIVNQNGTVAKAEFYYPYGGNRGTAFSTLTTKRFTGQYHETGLPGGEGVSYYNARWYDAQLGRFVSADTIVPDPGNPQDLNRLSYVRNNPLRFIDPNGHKLEQGSGGGSWSPLMFIINGIRQNGEVSEHSLQLRNSLVAAGYPARSIYVTGPIYTGGTLLDTASVVYQHYNVETEYGDWAEIRVPVRIIANQIQDDVGQEIDLFPGRDVVLVAHSGGAPTAITIGAWLESEYSANVQNITTIGSILVDELRASEVAEQVNIVSAKGDPLGYSEFAINPFRLYPPNVSWRWIGWGGHNSYASDPILLELFRDEVLGMGYLQIEP